MKPSPDAAADTLNPHRGHRGSAASSSPGPVAGPRRAGDRSMPQESTRADDTVRLHPDGIVSRGRPPPPAPPPPAPPPAVPASPIPAPIVATPAAATPAAATPAAAHPEAPQSHAQ